MEYAVNPSTGDIMQWDPQGGPQWSPVPDSQIAHDPNTKQVYVNDGKQWQTLPSPSTGSTAKDIGLNALTGVARGVAQTGALPRTIYDLLAQPPGKQYGIDPNSGLTVEQPQQQQQAPNPNAITVADVMHQLPTQEDMNRLLFQKLGLPYYTPSTTAGRIGQEALAAAVPGALGGVPGAAYGAAGGAAAQGAAELGMPPYVQAAAQLLPAAAGAVIQGGRTMLRPFTETGQKQIAADVLHQAAGGEFTPRAAPVPGTPMSLGQSTGNVGLLELERSAFARPPFPGERPGEINMPLAKGNMVTTANQRMMQELERTGAVPGAGMNAPAAEAASGTMQQAIRKHELDLAEEEKNAWNRIPGTSMTIPSAPIVADLQRNIADLGPARQTLLPGYIQAVIKQWGPEITFNDIKELRTLVGNDMADAIKTAVPNRNKASALAPIDNALRNYMDTLASMDPRVQQQLTEARQATARYHAIFDDPEIKSIIDTQGPWDRVKSEAVASKFIKLGGGGADSYDKFLVAAGNTPQARQAATEYVTAQMMRTIQGRPLDATGTPLIVAGNLRKFVNDNRSLIDHPDLFTPAQRDIINRVADQADLLAQTQRLSSFGVGGPDSYNKLAGNRFLDALVGQKGAMAIKLVGGLVGYNLTNIIGGPVVGIGGMIGGYALGRKAAESLYEPAQRSVITLINRALTDPKIASDLQKFRSDPRLGTLTPSLRTLFGVSVGAASTTVKTTPPPYRSNLPPPPAGIGQNNLFGAP